MLEGLVQHDFQLTIQHILGRMRGVYGDSEVVTLTDRDEVDRVADEVARAVLHDAVVHDLLA